MRLLIVAVCAAMLWISCAEAEKPNGHVITEVYTVQSGDTLDGISYQYMAKSSVRRDVREFRSGIEELNWDLLKDRQRGMIYPGDKLLINYYVIEVIE